MYLGQCHADWESVTTVAVLEQREEFAGGENKKEGVDTLSVDWWKSKMAL